MAEYLSPYTSKIEGFNGSQGGTTVADLFNSILTVGPDAIVQHPVCSQSSGAGAGSCATSSGNVRVPTIITTNDDPEYSSQKTSFLTSVLLKEKASVDSLIDTAKRISPLVKSVAQIDTAYDARFEQNAAVKNPAAGATLQGFAILLLVISYIVFSILSTIIVNRTSGNAYYALYTFIGSLILGLLFYTLLVRLA